MKPLHGLLLFLFVSTNLFAQKFTISGYVKDKETGEGMIAATVLVKELKQGTTTNEYGFYSLSLEQGRYTIEWSFIGFQTVSEVIDLNKNFTRTIELGFGENLLGEVVVTGEREDANVTSTEIGVNKIDIELVKKIPQLLGEADIIRSILLLPGVTTVGEGASGFNVRGGNIDQNLILLDESPVFSSSHLFGFFSVFNADAIKDTKLYKGGIPAKYGGRLSSVLDIRQRDGNAKKFSARGGVGLLFSRLTVEGPLVKDKVSFLIAGRRSYFDLFFPISKNAAINTSKLYFYDLNGKINWTINDKNRVYLSGYSGNDIFGFSDLFNTQWGNNTASARWNHLFNDKLFANFTGIYSQYSYALGTDFGALGFDWRAKIINYTAKADFTYYLNPKNTLEFGWHNTYYQFSPGSATGYFAVGDNNDTVTFKVPDIPAIETAFYVSNEQKIGARINLSYGVRYSGFAQTGPGKVYLYPNNIPVSDNPLVSVKPNDSIQYSNSDIVKLYHGIEPRFAGTYIINEESSVKLGYNRMRQYIHLISNTTAATPVDIYMPAGKYIKPAIVDQVSMGYFKNFFTNKYEGSAEVYFKKFKDIVDYKDRAELLLNNTIETELYSGIGRAYGLELQIKKNKGKLTGWVSYTLSRAERKVEQINQGNWYLANWNKTHDISVVASYDITKKLNISSNFAYMSSRPISFPDGMAYIENKYIPIYNRRNDDETPAYHRLDLSGNYSFDLKKKREGIDIKTKSWRENTSLDLAFGAYNVYARKNPYSIYFREDPDNPGVMKSYQLSIYATVIPYITLNFKF